ncbi:MAG: multidrug efflux system membrane fusion protein [Hyphomicrobiaceae bacterium]|jgi:multidrug efflux system membrane fusion protein
MNARLKLFLPFVVLAVAVAGSALLISARPAAVPVERQESAPLVQTIQVELRDVEFVVQAQGEVRPRAEISLVSEVDGRAVWVSPALSAGGTFVSGDPLLRIDPRDSKLTVESARAEVARAQTLVAREQAEAAVAAAEWRDIGSGQAPPLVAREPQLAEARAILASARSILARAELDLSRTQIHAPFDGRTRAKEVDEGQFVARGSMVAKIYAVDAVEIRLPIPDRELEFLDLDLSGSAAVDGAGPATRISGAFAGTMHRWEGKVVRVEGELDPRTRMVGVVVRVDDPYADNDEGRPPLAVGMYVHAAVFGRTGRDIVVLPRAALRDEDHVYVVDEEDRLHFRKVSVRRKEPERVLVDAGLQRGERVCVSSLDVVVENMRVRVAGDDAGDSTGPAS